MKRAIILAGGGSKGIFSVGVLKWMILKENKSWDIISGVSVGALNAAFLASNNDEKQAVIDLENFWLKYITSKSKVFQKKSWLKYTLDPLKKLVNSVVNVANTKYHLRIGVVSYDSGQYKVITEKDNDFNEWLLASSALPYMVEPIEIDGERWLDGGVRNNVPIREVIQEFGNQLEEIDVVMNEPYRPTNKDSFIKRIFQIFMDKTHDFEGILSHAPKNIKKITVYFPKKNLFSRTNFNLMSYGLKEGFENHNKIIYMR